MFKKILIANRGEIACRVAATARRLGVKTVAVYSEPDAGARHVLAGDEAVAIGGAAPKDSYLRVDRILAAAKATGAQAVHPGYGFLSENEGFAQACADAGIAFIGPPASAIAAMGSKSAAKALMGAAGVPLVPGYHGERQEAAFLREQADAIGYPVLIKASAGGGGKGMRIVHKAADFDAALASCKREAKSAFSDDAVLIERYVLRPRHIEIQLFADTLGNCVYLFERDCSVQRRHQKVIEEAPAPGMTPERRRAMGEAAVAAARAVGYVGAGTVEFIADQDGHFYFMEMNTRLQVEHPVTEMITGHDLVEWQLRVAAGERLPALQDQLTIRGHAIESRVYAENPDKGFLPSTGTLRYLRTPPAVAFEIGNARGGTPAPVRIDSGVREGAAISPWYDPMIAKLIVWGEDRAQAISRMDHALGDFDVVGLTTNVNFLRRLMRCDAFSGADLDTGLIERERAALMPAAAAPTPESLVLAAAAVLAIESDVAPAGKDPWAARSGWRAGAWLSREFEFTQAKVAHPVSVDYGREAFTVHAGGESLALTALAYDRATRRLSGLAGSHAFDVRAMLDGETLHLFSANGSQQFGYAPALAHAGDDAEEGGQLTAPMPGKVVALLCGKGERVSKGQPLMVMEAMKMEHAIAAPSDGEVTELLYAVGDQVAEGAQLIGFAAA